MSILKSFQPAGIRFHPEAFLHGVEFVLDGPIVIGKDPRPIYFVFVLNNAAHTDLWHGECLGQNLYTPSLDHGFLKRFAGKLCDPAVWLNSARLQAGD